MSEKSKIRERLQTRLGVLRDRLGEFEQVLREPEGDGSKARVGEWDDDDDLVRSARAIREELGHVQGALRRLREGTYGRCEVCGKPIDPRRLQVRPQVAECFRCARGAANGAQP